MRVLILLIAGSCAGQAHDLITTKITWSREISRIFAERCLSCHGEGGPAPMTFQTFEQVRPWAKAVKEEVLQRRMPPWGAVKGFGDLHPDPSLTQEEVNRIAEWVEGGAPEGDAVLMPDMHARRLSFTGPSVTNLRVRDGFPLPRDLVVLGVTASVDVPSARMVATKPDGASVPIIWLREYKGEWRRKFWLRSRMILPRGTIIRIDGDAPMSLLIASGARKPAR